MAFEEPKGDMLAPSSFRSNPITVTAAEQSERVRKWRCCDCASLNCIHFSHQRKFVSRLARSLPAASRANSPEYIPAKYPRNFPTEVKRDVSSTTTVTGATTGGAISLPSIANALQLLDTVMEGQSSMWSFETTPLKLAPRESASQELGPIELAPFSPGMEALPEMSTEQLCWADGCEHARCKECFDVDADGRLISRCGGQWVDEGEYLTWCYLKGR